MGERPGSLDDGQETCTKEKTASLLFLLMSASGQKGAAYDQS